MTKENLAQTEAEAAQSEPGLQQRFRQAVAAHPDRTAVQSRSARYSYAELDRLSGRIGNYLRQLLGEEPRPVALLLDEGAHIASSLLGVLRSGSFYVVLSPRNPEERLRRILGDVEAAAVIASPSLLGRASDLAPRGGQVISFDSFQNLPDSDIWQSRRPEAVAAVYYTSGSTGEPKGIAQPYALIERRARIQVMKHGLGPDERVALCLSMSATASLSALFGTFFSGASVFIYDAEHLGIAPLKEVILQHEITYIRSPVELLRYFVDSLPDDAFFPSILRIGAAGDILYYRDLQRLLQHVRADLRFVTQYSMSEFGTLTTKSFSLDEPMPEGKVPLGLPLPGREFVILGEDGQPVPGGDVGEIHLRTDIPFGGYWNRPDLTADITLSDPQNPGRVLYRTGDLGRIRPDGQLELAGRRDQRAKIRGFTVDMSAVESALMTVPGVRRGVVVAHQEPSGRKRLVAYLVPAPGFQLSTRHLRRMLAKQLPDYMLPSLFVTLPQLPLTRTGKIDRKALPAPRWDTPERTAVFVAPRDDLERGLVRMWHDILHLESVGIDDDFFDLGGDSLMAASLMASIEKASGRTLPVTVILKAPTVRKQAELLQANDMALEESALIPIRTRGSKPPLFCLGGKGGTPLRFNRLLSYLNEDQPVYYFRSRGLQAGERTADFVEEIAADFLADVRRVQPHGPYQFLGESGGGLVAYEMARRLSAEGAAVGFLGMLDTYLPNIRNARASKWMLLRKHLQTLTSGGANGLRLYTTYYAGLLRYQLHRLGTWMHRTSIRILHPGLLERYDRIEAANIHAGRAYAPGSYAGSVHLFHAAAQAQYDGTGGSNGWDNVQVANLVVHSIDCYHGNILFEPFVSQVAEVMTRQLA